MQNNIERFNFHKEWQKLNFFDTGLQNTMLYFIKTKHCKPLIFYTSTVNIKRSLQLLLNWLSTRQYLINKRGNYGR